MEKCIRRRYVFDRLERRLKPFVLPVLLIAVVGIPVSAWLTTQITNRIMELLKWTSIGSGY
jgi:hypothetical protein